MLQWSILGLSLLVGGVLILRWAAGVPRDRLVRALVWAAGGMVLAAGVYLAATGRMGWAAAALSALTPWVLRALRLHAAWRMLKRQFGGGGGGGGGGASAGGPNQAPRAANGKMTREEALAVLGLKEGASRDEIQAAYKRLMQKVHPDVGGTQALASRLNQARDTLLG
jgi:DnaJ family protein C protein 19